MFTEVDNFWKIIIMDIANIGILGKMEVVCGVPKVRQEN
jgi:hypothetical protein